MASELPAIPRFLPFEKKAPGRASETASVPKQERIRIQERLRSDLARAVAEGKRLGRPHRFLDRRKVLRLHREGRSLREIARAVGVSAMTVQRLLRALDSDPMQPALRY